MQAVIYCRVSTRDQVHNLSLPTQEKSCVDYCQRNGYGVNKVFVEQGESAKTADRTELKNLLAYCRQNKGRIEVVVVYAVSRFAREKFSHLILREQLASLGITLRSVTEPIDDSSTGKMIEGFLSTIAQFDNDIRSERTVTGMKARLDRGGWTFPPPLGYLKSTDANGNKTIIPDPKRAGLITQAFEMYSMGLYSKHQVLDHLTHLGLTAKSGKPVSGQAFCQLLQNWFYAGILDVPSWGVRRPSNAAALVSRETFDKVQALIDGRRRTVTPHQRNNPDFPLRHFVRCGRCDHPLTASWSKGRNGMYAYYHCQNRFCKAVNVRREEMERLFVDFLGQFQAKPEYVRLFGEIIIDVWKQKQAQATALHEVAQRRVNRLLDRRQRLREAFIYDRVIDQRTYQEELEQTERRTHVS